MKRSLSPQDIGFGSFLGRLNPAAAGIFLDETEAAWKLKVTTDLGCRPSQDALTGNGRPGALGPTVQSEAPAASGPEEG